MMIIPDGFRLSLLLLLAVLLSSCVRLPAQITPVSDFELQRYLGTWYEIARLDHSFERGLSRVSAEYSMRPDGGVRVINRGYKAADDSWSEAEGRAYFVDGEETGFLKVSFFGPFYGAYAIFELDQDYQYAFVSGPNTDYLWLLARTPEPEPQIIADFIQRADELGFASDELIMVSHD